MAYLVERWDSFVTCIVYIDVYFTVNLVMNLLALWFTALVLRFPVKWLRIILSACLGAIWACAVVMQAVLPLWLEAGVTYVLVSGVMAAVAFGYTGIKPLLKAVGGMYLAVLLLGGLGNLIYSWAGNRIYGLGLLAAGALFLIRYIWIPLWEDKKMRGNMYQVILHYQGRELKITALLDTGNRLYEPYAHRPVNVITYEACQQLMTGAAKWICIPYQAVGTEQGMLYGVTLDSMEITKDGSSSKVEKPLVAIYKKSLSSDGEYQMLLHHEVLDH